MNTASLSSTQHALSSESAASDTPIVETRGISRRGDTARSAAHHDDKDRPTLLHPTDFALRAGERVALTGASGSGKSVFLRALALLDPLDSGTVLWRGQTVARANIPRFRRHVAYLRQRPALIDGTVEDNLRYPFSLAVYRDARFDAARVQALLADAGRGADFLDRPASELSGGESQIVALVRVLQLDPDVLLLDEPTASLDPESVRAVETLVANWCDSGNASARSPRATVWVSHDLAQAARIANRRLTMSAGVLAEYRDRSAAAPAVHVNGAAR